MLANAGPEVEPQAIAEPALLVQLPQSLADFFAESGYVSPSIFEVRSSIRLRVRSQATLTSIRLPPFAKRSTNRARVLIKDMSRKGICILSHQQMWPTEEFTVGLHQRLLTCRVVRCSKLGECCYEVGATIDGITNQPC